MSMPSVFPHNEAPREGDSRESEPFQNFHDPNFADDAPGNGASQQVDGAQGAGAAGGVGSGAAGAGAAGACGGAPESCGSHGGSAHEAHVHAHEHGSAHNPVHDAVHEAAHRVGDVAASAHQMHGFRRKKHAHDASHAHGEQHDVVSEAEDVLREASDKLSADLEAARKDAATWQDKFVRLHAEWDTYRRRMNEQREEEKLLACEKLVKSLLPLLDDFDRTISYAQEHGEAGLLEGVCAVNTKLLDTLSKSGLETIDPQGCAFDALECQAVATVDDPEQPDETVAAVFQKGYRMGSKVLRAAMVSVTTGGPKRPSGENQQ